MIEGGQYAIAYPYKDGLYLNLTNRCPTACEFCVKRIWDWRYRGFNLKLRGGEPTAKEAWEAVCAWIAERPFQELVFCGYGESTYRLPALIEIGSLARRYFPDLHLRLVTIGLGNLIWGRNITPELRPWLDVVSVSLNTADPLEWLALHAPLEAYRREGFESVLEFIRDCAMRNLETCVTAVAQPGVDIKAVEALANSLGASFRLRPPLPASA
jgi:TatD DNase family protein